MIRGELYLFVVAVRVGDNLWQRIVWLCQQIGVIVKIRLILVARSIRFIKVGNEWSVGSVSVCTYTTTIPQNSRRAPGDVADHRKRMADTNDVLYIQIGFAVVIVDFLVVHSTVDERDRETLLGDSICGLV